MHNLMIEAPDGSLASLADLPTAAYRTDAGGHILAFNEQAVALWGRRPKLGELWCGSHKIYHMNGAPMPHADCPMARSLLTGVAVTDAQALCETPEGRINAVRP